ncbi:MAG: four helix bundle protein [Candidatus Latescibacteria bacterium]|nr:four helix bundle protein [Candidatus Latescibacterota bacterium]
MGGKNKPPYEICERTFEFALRIVKLCRNLDQTPGVARSLAHQLLRAETSIGANVEEAQAGQSRADFVSKYSIARKEARETKYWLRIVAANGVNNSPSDIDSLIAESEELLKILTTIIKNAAKE